MTDAVVLAKLVKSAKSYSRDVAELITASSTTEATFYPAVRSLVAAALEAEELPFDSPHQYK
jgi:hypothetical protein